MSAAVEPREWGSECGEGVGDFIRSGSHGVQRLCALSRYITESDNYPDSELQRSPAQPPQLCRGQLALDAEILKRIFRAPPRSHKNPRHSCARPQTDGRCGYASLQHQGNLVALTVQPQTTMNLFSRRQISDSSSVSNIAQCTKNAAANLTLITTARGRLCPPE